MRNTVPIRALFMDIGGVLLRNGCDHRARKRAVKEFNLEPVEMETRHQMTFDTYEEGNLTKDEYLDHVVLSRKRWGHSPRHWAGWTKESATQNTAQKTKGILHAT